MNVSVRRAQLGVSQDLLEGKLIERESLGNIQDIDFYAGSIGPKDIPVMRKSEHKALLSSRQLSTLAASGTKIKDMAQLCSQKVA